MDGEHLFDEDEFGLRIRDQYFACGCRTIRHEFHDGSLHLKSVRHDGKRIKGEFGPDHGC